jgi:ribose-phosphate pyrophosphokinase
MILFTFERHAYLAPSILNLPGNIEGGFSISRFPNGELSVRLETSVTNKACIVLGNITPDDETLLAFALLCDTLDRHGSYSVVACIPYLGYARQDTFKKGESLAAAWVGRLLDASGIRSIVTIEPHSPQVQELFPMPAVALSAVKDLVRECAGHLGPEVTVVAPDSGAVPRAEAFASAAGILRPVVRFEKTRSHEGVTVSGPSGPVGPKAVIVDDMIDTGRTLLAVVRKMREHGVEDIIIAVTHGLFTGAGWQELWQMGVRHIWCTDSVPQTPDDRRITVVSVGGILSNYFRPQYER